MGFEVGLLQNTPDAGTTHEPGATLRQGRHQVVETPACGGTVERRGFTGGHRHHLQTLCGGKSAAAEPSAVHLGGRRGHAPDSAGANDQPYGGYTATRWPLADSTDGPALQPARSPDNERPRLGGWNGL